MSIKKLYVKVKPFDDYSDFLIDYSLYSGFESQLDDLYDYFSSGDIDEQCYIDRVDDLLDTFNAIKLEGQQYFVVLENDLEGL